MKDERPGVNEGPQDPLSLLAGVTIGVFVVGVVTVDKLDEFLSAGCVTR